MKKALLIVDPQFDFITGTLPVEGAGQAMDSLAQYINEHDVEYQLKIITLDWHPYGHSSFVGNGGQWPVHCVSYTKGAAVWQSVFDAVHATAGSVEILTKGTIADKEEYSIFQNAESSRRLINLIQDNEIEQIDICGIAGDVCVLSTLIDGVSIFGRERFSVLTEYCPSLDGGEKLHDYIAK